MSSISSSVQKFCATITSFVSQISLRLNPPTPPSSSQPQSSPPIDIESQLVTTLVENQNQIMLQWKNIGMAFCFTSAFEISLLFAKTNSQLSNSLHLLSFAIFLTFLFLFVSNFIAHKYARTAQVLEKIAVLLVATAVVFTITIPFPLILKCVTWALYSISLIVVLIGQKLELRTVDRYKRSPAFDAFMYREYYNKLYTVHDFYSAKQQATENAVNRFQGFMEEEWEKALSFINDQQKNKQAHCRKAHADPLPMHLEMVGKSAALMLYA
ncbi:hypothetical protein LWI29_022605 [Acer saccharum]|uniref:Uncharacterized protein n=1 Tax=Acer saccharum TaxID=4024 RepID=A0AA39W8R9_ACESA|nr:hypothetical protein LWI29_022605 [Acer saccharum]